MKHILDIAECHAKYVKSDERIKNTVNEAFEAVVKVFKTAGFPSLRYQLWNLNKYRWPALTSFRPWDET
jgi:hypothetical protein